MLTTILVVVCAVLAGALHLMNRALRGATADIERVHAALKATREALITQGHTLQRVSAERDELLQMLDANRVYEPHEARVRALTGACVAGWPRTWRVRMGDA